MTNVLSGVPRVHLCCLQTVPTLQVEIAVSIRLAKFEELSIELCSCEINQRLAHYWPQECDRYNASCEPVKHNIINRVKLRAAAEMHSSAMRGAALSAPHRQCNMTNRMQMLTAARHPVHIAGRPCAPQPRSMQLGGLQRWQIAHFRQQTLKQQQHRRPQVSQPLVLIHVSRSQRSVYRCTKHGTAKLMQQSAIWVVLAP